MENEISNNIMYSTSDLADYEYCALSWWYQYYDELAIQDNEELFARMVELEDSHNTQAPLLPEYQVIEQILVKRGAFAHSEELPELTPSEEQMEELSSASPLSTQMRRRLQLALYISGGLAMLLLITSFILSMR